MGHLFSLLSEGEVYGIDYIRSHADESAFGAPKVTAERVLAYWEEAKGQYLAQMFGGQLILSKPIEVKSNPQEIADIISSETYYKEPYRSFRSKYNRYWNDWEENTTCPNKYDVLSCVNELLRPYFLATNIYNYDTVMVPLPDGTNFKLNKGCKTMKALGKICKAIGMEEDFEQLRIRVSQILNEAYLRGTLHLSIHPLDYLTASYNDNDWTSCMNIMDGEYRRGVVEMMNSPCVVVGYLTSSDDYHNKFSMDGGSAVWNSKKWREFFIVDPKVIIGVKGYPYWNLDLEKACVKWLRDLVIQNLAPVDNRFSSVWSAECHQESLGGSGDVLHDDSINASLSLNCECGPAMYNDFGFRCQGHQYVLPQGVDGNHTIIYSGESECLGCGCIIDDDEHTHYLTCAACSDSEVCYNCGTRISPFDAYTLNDRCYCSYCMDNFPSCDICNDAFDPEETYSPKEGETLNWAVAGINIGDEKKQVVNRTYVHVCPYCAGSTFTDNPHKHLRRAQEVDTWCHNTYIFIPVEFLTEKGREFLCGFEDGKDVDDFFNPNRYGRIDISNWEVSDASSY